MNYLSKELIEQINTTLNNNGIIVFVTDTVWGMGCLPTSEVAVKKIYEIKKREAKKPLILMSNNVEHLYQYVDSVPPIASDLINKHFPGALTLVLNKSEKTPFYITSEMNTVGIRVPNNQVFKEICENISGHVLATTSANLSNEPSAKSYIQAIENMGQKADLIIEDFGQQAKGLESTVAAAFDGEVKVFRHGAISL